MQNLNKNISDRLKTLMETHYMTQKDLAEALGVSQTAVYSWCNGIKAPRMDKIDKIAELFNVKRSYVLGLDEKDFENGFYTFDEKGNPTYHVKGVAVTPPPRPTSPNDEQLKRVFAYVSRVMELSPEKQKQITDYIDYIAEKD